MIRIVKHLLLIWLAALIFDCSRSPVELIDYVPEVTFTGYLNASYDSLTGNRAWPNRCYLAGDTIRIYCYSSGFSEVNKIRHGDLLRIDLFPDSGDGFEKRNTLFHLARYYNQNESYTINKGDSVDITIRFESEIIAYSPQVNAPLELDNIYVATPPLGPGQHLEIIRGHLFGRVHRK